MSTSKLLAGSKLKLGDRVLDASNHQIGVLTVYQIKGGLISFHRPYTHTTDFSTTSGLICYTGVEIFNHPIDDSRYQYELISRKQIK